jgi:Major Facilitator Superfamily
MVPSTGALILNAFAPGERGKAMGIYTGVSMVFLALGPLVGGLLTQGVSWRAVFFINLPIGVAIVAAAHFTLPRRPRPRVAPGAIDWVGFPLLLGGLGALVVGAARHGAARAAVALPPAELRRRLGAPGRRPVRARRRDGVRRGLVPAGARLQPYPRRRGDAAADAPAPRRRPARGPSLRPHRGAAAAGDRQPADRRRAGPATP